MVVKFKKAYTKNKPCPICGNDACKENEAGLILCLRSDSKEAAPEGYQYRGQSKDGQWGLYVLEGDVAVQPQSVVTRLSPDQFLSLPERGQAYEHLIKQLPSSLYPHHHAWLRRRGYEDHYIDFLMTLGMRSYDSKRVGKLEGLSPLIPGVNTKRPHRLMACGLLLPMPGWDSQILGFQFVPEDRIQADASGRTYEGAKYKWLSSGSNANTLLLPPPYSSNPHAFFMPDMLTDTQTLGLTEGVLKGAFTAYKMGHAVLSTAGAGLFDIEQLRSVIETYGFTHIILYPDAGMLYNKHISAAYFKLYQSVKELDLDLLVAWWGQNTKSVGDIDDLLLRQASASIKRIPYVEYFKFQEQEIQEKLLNQISKAQMPREGGVIYKQPPVEDLSAERLSLRNEIERLLQRPAVPGMTIIASPTGLGKSTTGADVVASLLRQGRGFDKKLLILVHKQDDAKDWVEKIRKNSLFVPQLFLMLGRSKEPKSPFYCRDYDNVQRSAKNRQYVRCTCGTQDGFDCPYLRKVLEMIVMLKKAGECVVVSTYASFINDGNKLNLFDTVIIDESIFDANLVESITVTLEDVKALYKRLNKDRIEAAYPKEHPLLPFLDAVKQVLSHSIDITNSKGILDFRSLWQVAYQGSDADLELLISSEGNPDIQKDQCLVIERNAQVKRFIVDLVQAIRNLITSIMVTEKGIEFAKARNALVHLRNMEVINLDATPNKPLLEEVFHSVDYFGEGYSLSNVDIIQVPGRVYTRSVLNADAAKRREVESIINRLIDQYDVKAPFVVVPKPLYGGNDIDPDSNKAAYININHPDVKMAYFGGETRGSNRFQTCDAIFIVGHHQEPVHITEMRVNALRRSMPVKGDTSKAVRQMELVGDSEWVPARLQHCHPDSLTQFCIEHGISSHIIQAIGRLRAISRPGQNLKAFIINGTLLAGIPIDKVIQIDDLLKDLGLRAPRRKPKTLAMFDKMRSIDTVGKICQAVISDPAIGRNKLNKNTGVSAKTVSIYLQPIKAVFQQECKLVPSQTEFYVLLGTREPYRVEERIAMSWFQLNCCLKLGLISFDWFIGWQNIPGTQSA
jgi:hypothetical protein